MFNNLSISKSIPANFGLRYAMQGERNFSSEGSEHPSINNIYSKGNQQVILPEINRHSRQNGFSKSLAGVNSTTDIEKTYGEPSNIYH